MAAPRRSLVGAVLAIPLLAPSAALAHAQLEGTVPARGATVRREPPAAVFRFDETVEGNFGAVRVFDARGDRVDAGDAFHPGGRGPELGVHLKPRLPEGTYTATYRVISADGHVVSGGFVFSIGRPGAAPGESVGELAGGTRTGAVTDAAFGLARGLQYAAIAVAVGGVAFLLLAWLPALRVAAGTGPSWRLASDALVRRSRRLLVGACVVGIASAAAGIVLEGATAAGVSGWSALAPKILREVLATRFGTVWGLGALDWAMAGALLALALGRAGGRAPVLRPAGPGATGVAPPRRTATGPLSLVAVPLGLLVLLPSFAGHASTQRPTILLFPLNVLHVLAMGLWFGGLVALLFVLPAATRELAGSDRGRLLAGAVARFSTLALAAVAALLASGLVQAYLYVRTPAGLGTTAYGRAVLIKFGLLMAVIAVAAYNRQRSVPRLERIAAGGEAPGQAGVLLRRALRAEVALVVVVIGVTAALASYAPPIAAHTGPVSKTATVGPAQLQLTVDPARVGANQIHLYLLNPRDGSQFTGAKEVDVAETLPAKRIGPLNQGASAAGPGHYIVPGALLVVPGTWWLTVTVRVSDFDEYSTTVEVPVR